MGCSGAGTGGTCFCLLVANYIYIYIYIAMYHVMCKVLWFVAAAVAHTGC
jgi:hypothetical protein